MEMVIFLEITVCHNLSQIGRPGVKQNHIYFGKLERNNSWKKEGVRVEIGIQTEMNKASLLSEGNPDCEKPAKKVV